MNHFDSDNISALEQWIIDSRDGDDAALNRLAEYLLPKAFEIARYKMQAMSPMEDHEDVAISAVKSICLRFRNGSCDFLGEEQLGGLLQQFVLGKVRGRRKYHFAEKRDVKLDRLQSSAANAVQNRVFENAESVWLDEESAILSLPEQEYLEQMLSGLGADVQGLFSELVKRLDEKPRQVLMLITSDSMSNMELAEALDCAPSSIERYRRAIRKKLDEIVNE